jgi:hypothetical protein
MTTSSNRDWRAAHETMRQRVDRTNQLQQRWKEDATDDKLGINEIWAYISVDNEGNEGICAFLSNTSGAMMPMVCADRERVEQLRPIAKQLAKISPYPIKLVKFSLREDVEQIE